ncbi:protoporphyrin IX magnesium-chelatase [Methanococcoides vulcani]|uniref:Protoporphyrin IX magnesium-chelatase n=2 Tax=Methanococcoides vulcani TaxID=1353158 RepID=A0A1H9YMT3_9EURY|nr:protoporphyrin IX magnesium-chelatase [Methanococcoides vulcani]
MERPVYPFSAIVGQEAMKEALLMNVIDPSIGGVLIRGEKGTAKSTAVRALADLLPERKAVHGCVYGCISSDHEHLCADCRQRVERGEQIVFESRPMRVVELPLSATEDRVAGTLDIEHALTSGKKRFEPGVLARANGNILYVDEINLLDDHLVDLLLDAAAMGVNFVEREGVSFSHPSRFVMVGTMNPEEGDLRPQLLDRFGLAVDVAGEQDTNRRMEVIRRRLAFEADPHTFISEYMDEQEQITQAIISARERLAQIKPDEDLLRTAVEISLHLGVDGHRADLTLVKAAISAAALDGSDTIGLEHILKAARLALPHRMRRRPFEEGYLDMEELETWLVKRLDD